MTIVVETGTGDPAAESYISVAEADAYFESVGETSWGSKPYGQKETALRRATNYIGETYQLRWKGCRASTTQALDWPRLDVESGALAGTGNPIVPSTKIPVALRRATAQFALQALLGNLSPVLKPIVLSKTIGPIKVVYDNNSRESNKYVTQDKLLAPYLKGSVSGSMMKLVRS